MREALLLLYCTVVGYVASGIGASFFRLITARPARFGLLGAGYLGAASTYAFFAVTGPAIIVEMAVTRSLPRENTLAWLAGCFVAAVLWSACSGVVLVELIYSIRGSI
jgi:hypothetical protein